MSATETAALPPGATVKHYAVIDSVGFDHQGCIYRAECGLTHRTVMLYEYLPSGLAIRGAGTIQALPGRAEALTKAISAYATRLRAASLVGHAALPTLEDIWQQNGTLYAVGAWQPGRSLLTELVSRGSQIAPELLRHWARIVGDALAALHRHGLVHGNLSPATTWLLDNGTLLLPPMGGGVFDTDVPAWIAPEQHPLNPRPAPIGPWTDVYQLSALMHQAITGLPPPPVTRRWEGAPLDRLPVTSGLAPVGLVPATRKGLTMLPNARQASIAQWLDEAGLPDRREHPRFDDAEAPDAAPPVAATLPGAAPIAPVAPAAYAAPAVETLPVAMPMTATAATEIEHPAVPAHADAGHQPLPAHVQQRLGDLEFRPPRSTPAWVWIAAILAVSGLVGIVIVA